MFDDFNLKQKDKYYLIFLLIFNVILIGYYINFNNNIGIFCSDVYIYLLNAAFFSGKHIASTQNIYLSPVICFLTSILFKLGLYNKFAIYLVTGAFAVLGNIGFYILLKRYFDENLSLCGSIIYSSIPLYLIWLANGTLDIPAVSIIIWIALFTVLAVDENPKYYQHAIILIAIGVFTRYTVLLTVPAFILYYVLKKGFKIKHNDLKYILKGIVIAAIISLIIFAAITLVGNSVFGAGSQISDGFSGNQGSEIDPAYNTNVSYYITNIPNFLSTSHVFFDANPVLENSTILSWGIIGLLIIGMSIWLYEHKRKIEKKDIIPILFFIVAIISFTRTSSVLTTIFVLIGLYLLGKDSENKIEYFMLGWIFSNIIFLSYYNIKVNRYFLPAFPAIIYFVILSVKTISNHLKINKNIIPLILIILFIAQAFAFPLTVDATSEYIGTENISNYIIDNNPDYENITVGVYNIRPYSWWLGENTIGIPAANQTAIDESNVTYYISNHKLNDLTNYTEIKMIEPYYLYEKSV